MIVGGSGLAGQAPQVNPTSDGRFNPMVVHQDRWQVSHLDCLQVLPVPGLTVELGVNRQARACLISCDDETTSFAEAEDVKCWLHVAIRCAEHALPIRPGVWPRVSSPTS